MPPWNITARALARDSGAVTASYDDAAIPRGFLFTANETQSLLNASLINDTLFDYPPPPYEIWQAILIAIACSFIVIGTVAGNLLVCLSVLLVNKLRTPSNLLIVSLAVSDLLIGILVMPFAITMEIMGRWVHGSTFCDAWTSLDVLLCTASILNLCVISIDRYMVITRPFDYGAKRTTNRMLLMILAVWSLAALLSIPPLFGWNRPGKSAPGMCHVSQALSYQIYATLGAFYVPLSVMIFIYYQIYKVSARITRKEAESVPAAGMHYTDVSGRSSPHRKDSTPEENHNCRDTKRSGSCASDATTAMLSTRSGGLSRANGDGHGSRLKGLFNKKNGTSLPKANSHDCKATKTLGLIMGSFTICWLPFFIIALSRAFCNSPATCIPYWLTSFFLWLGYANSLLNPIIYARFNQEFRRPFREILLCRCCGINRRLRTESYAEQYGRAEVRLPRQSIRSPVNSVVRFNSHGQTEVRLGNGTAPT